MSVSLDDIMSWLNYSFAHGEHFPSYYGPSKSHQPSNYSAVLLESFQSRKCVGWKWLYDNQIKLIHYKRLKISYSPIQRHSCGKACIWVLLTAVSSIQFMFSLSGCFVRSSYLIVSMVLLQSVSVCLWSRLCLNENYTLCVYSVTMQEQFL